MRRHHCTVSTKSTSSVKSENLNLAINTAVRYQLSPPLNTEFHCIISLMHSLQYHCRHPKQLESKPKYPVAFYAHITP
jgi:hypothetical protein